MMCYLLPDDLFKQKLPLYCHYNDQRITTTTDVALKHYVQLGCFTKLEINSSKLVLIKLLSILTIEYYFCFEVMMKFASNM